MSLENICNDSKRILMNLGVVAAVALTSCTDGPCPSGTDRKGVSPPQEFLEYCAREDGVKHGPATFWHKNGKIAQTGEFNDGKRNGVWITWNEAGIKVEEEGLQNNKQHGAFQKWFDNGTLEVKANYKNGKKEGEWSTWYENGNPAEKGMYADDKRDGFWTAWCENGTKQAEGSFNAGSREGTWYYSGCSGSTKEKVREHGEKVYVSASDPTGCFLRYKRTLWKKAKKLDQRDIIRDVKIQRGDDKQYTNYIETERGTRYQLDETQSVQWGRLGVGGMPQAFDVTLYTDVALTHPVRLNMSLKNDTIVGYYSDGTEVRFQLNGAAFPGLVELSCK